MPQKRKNVVVRQQKLAYAKGNGPRNKWAPNSDMLVMQCS